MMSDRATFLLVHGTFARGAQWTAPESPLCKVIISAATSAGLNADIRQVPWSGRNRTKDRIAAGKEIARRLGEVDRAMSPRVFLIGHSHGGSAIAYFLLSRRPNDPRVSGCAFLSTPFIAARVRPDAFLIYATLLAVVSTVAFALLSVLLSVTIGGAISLIFRNFGGSNLAALAIDAVAAMIVGLVLSKQPMVYQRMIARCKSRIAGDETAGVDVNKCLLVRCSRDEAATALAFGQFMATLTTTVTSAAMFMVAYASLIIGRARRSFLGLTLVLGVTLFYGFFVADVIVAGAFGHWGYIWHGAFDFGETFDFPITWVSIFFNFVLRKVLWIPFATITLLLLACIVLYLGAGLINALVIWSFGWVNFTDAIFAEVSVEPTPFGPHTFHHIPWSDDARRPPWSALSHSASYQNPAALEALRSWLSKALSEPPAGDEVVGSSNPAEQR